MYTKFCYISKYGKKDLYEVPSKEAWDTAVSLLERSQDDDLGPLYVFINDSWVVIDYYNIGEIL